MSALCPQCQSPNTTPMVHVDRHALGTAHPALAAGLGLPSQAAESAMLRAPRRRHIPGRIALFFLAAASLAWPIGMVIHEQLEGSRLQPQSASQFQLLPPGSAHAAAPSASAVTSPMGIFYPVMLFVILLAVLVALGRNLHNARLYNQNIWGPAFERWSHSHYCNDCAKIFVTLPQAIPPHTAQPFKPTTANTSAA